MIFKIQKHKRAWLVVILGLFIGSSLQAEPLPESQNVVKESSQSQTENCQLTFGWDRVEPFQYKTSDGEMEGYQIQLVESIMQRLGCQITYKQSYWSDLIEKLKKGEIDFMADATVTESRQKFSYFSNPYRQETFTLYVHRENYQKSLNKSIKALFDQGFRLGVTSGFVYSDELESLKVSEKYRDNFHFVDKNFDNYVLLRDKKIDGFIEDALVAGYTLRKAVLQRYIVALPGEVYRGDITFMFSKKNIEPDFIERFNQELAKIKKTKEYKRTWSLDLSS